MRRLFWVAVGAAGGIWAYRRGGEALENARERGVVGNITWATATAGRVAGTATKVMALAAEQGARTAGRLTERAPQAPDETARPTAGPTGKQR